LIGLRRIVASIPGLLKAAGDADPKVRLAALSKAREVDGLTGIGLKNPWTTYSRR